MRYLDSSAMVKLLATEAESDALSEHLVQVPYPARTSAIAIAEVGIAVSMCGSATLAQASIRSQPWVLLPEVRVLALPTDSEILSAAVALGTTYGLRALDAIHVATALALVPGLVEVVTYDRRMSRACLALGLGVVAPA